MCCFTHVNHSNYTSADWKQTTNKQTDKQEKLAEKNDASCCWKAISQGYHRGPDVSVLVTSINMQQNLAKLKDLKIQLNITNSTLCMWSFCPSKRESSLWPWWTSHLYYPWKAQSCRKLKDLWVVVNCSRLRVGHKH